METRRSPCIADLLADGSRVMSPISGAIVNAGTQPIPGTVKKHGRVIEQAVPGVAQYPPVQPSAAHSAAGSVARRICDATVFPASSDREATMFSPHSVSPSLGPRLLD